MNEWMTQKQNNIETELRKIQSVDRTPRKAMSPLSTNRSPISIKQFYKQTIRRKIKKEY